MNVFSFTGNLGKDCRNNEVNGTAVVNFSVAVKSGFGKHEQTVWVDVSLWGKPAEGALKDYLLKGQKVAVSGELCTKEHEGNTYITCRANSVSLIGDKSEGGKTESKPQQQPKAAPQGDFDDDMPF